MRVLQFILIITFTCFVSCNNNKEQEPKSKETTSDTKVQQPALKKDSIQESDSIDLEAASVKADEYYFDGDSVEWVGKNLLGCWLIPHSATINIKFLGNGRFEFNDYNQKLGEGELLSGSFSVSARDQTLILFYTDRPKQKFSFAKGEYPDDNYYIKNSSGYYFVKAPCELNSR